MYTIGEPEIQAAAETIRSGKLFRYQGEDDSQTDLFEQEWAATIGVKHALAVTSGTAALICALAGLGVGPGDEVIVPAYTFIASALAALAVGAVPILAEIDESLTLDPVDVEAKLTPRTKAIMPVHMNGLNCDLDALLDVATRHGLLVVEDACQADGGSYKGRRLGSIGHAGGFSFNYFKVISCGEGGAMVTDDDAVFERASLFADGGCVFFKEGVAGQTPIFAGWNFRFNEILSSIMRVQLTRLDGLLAGLREDKRLIREGLEGASGLAFNRVNDPAGECAVTLSLLFATGEEAAAFVARLGEAGFAAGSPINSGRHVYANWEAVMQQRGSSDPRRNPFRSGACDWQYTPDMCPRTLGLLARTVNLPMSPTRPAQERATLIAAIRQAAGS
jgi:dTDP-4-amino-4,6-dideoxygalactose transaminase